MNTHNAALYIYTGPMFSGKTTSLLRYLHDAAQAGLNCLYINHELDERSNDDNVFSTHNPLLKDFSFSTSDFVHPKNLKNAVSRSRRKSKGSLVIAVKTSELKNVNVSEFNVIGVDEAQWFDDLSTVISWVNEEDKHVVVAGLSSNYLRGSIGHIKDIMCQADNIFFLTAFCSSCRNRGKIKPAIHTKKIFSTIENESEDKEVNEPDPGSSEKYIALCRKCYNK